MIFVSRPNPSFLLYRYPNVDGKIMQDGKIQDGLPLPGQLVVSIENPLRSISISNVDEKLGGRQSSTSGQWLESTNALPMLHVVLVRLARTSVVPGVVLERVEFRPVRCLSRLALELIAEESKWAISSY